MSATCFPYYPQPQYAVPPFYGSQLQGAQEIHSSSVRPHSDLPGSQLQENNHSSSSSTGPKKNDMDEILGKRESINPRHVLESSHVPDSESPEMSELERDILEKDALDEEICQAAQKQRQGTAQNVSPPSECTVPSDGDESNKDQSLAFAESLFFKSKGKNKKPLASTPVPKRREADVEKKLPRKRAADAAERPSKKRRKKKGKAGSSGVDEPTLISFLERSQERDEAFMEQMAEAEREYRKDQQKFSMDALAMLGNILEDVSKGNE